MSRGKVGIFHLDTHQHYMPEPLYESSFNHAAVLPYGLTVKHLTTAMGDFLEFLGFINLQLYSRAMPPLEQFLMPAGFSSLVGEFMVMTLPRYCDTLVKNRYHNGHPDLIPKGMFADDAAQHAQDGIEIKRSRYAGGWQGHNPEAIWLMVFHFAASSSDRHVSSQPRPFAFVTVCAARLELEDWSYSGRSASSRRTITASVNARGMEKLRANWVYRISE